MSLKPKHFSVHEKFQNTVIHSLKGVTPYIIYADNLK